mmetsp:Transcript_9786/g.14353  ORF Transcript_9786/g.14353 Transcript_9786/m.14353 type:complete len:239 (+) Transcript_9786:313-1029(+)
MKQQMKVRKTMATRRKKMPTQDQREKDVPTVMMLTKTRTKIARMLEKEMVIEIINHVIVVIVEMITIPTILIITSHTTMMIIIILLMATIMTMIGIIIKAVMEDGMVLEEEMVILILLHPIKMITTRVMVVAVVDIMSGMKEIHNTTLIIMTNKDIIMTITGNIQISLMNRIKIIITGKNKVTIMIVVTTKMTNEERDETKNMTMMIIIEGVKVIQEGKETIMLLKQKQYPSYKEVEY